mmetsp:Transcript_15192/g.18799  ORF Transcript_15192/g.18799 Transcript_15192/m.18799 type:complete len:283 (-) Transcript_15192:1373-2221(-)
MQHTVESSACESNFEKQQEEVETLQEIYRSGDDDFQVKIVGGCYHKLSVSINGAGFHITLPVNYPNDHEIPEFSFKPWPGSSAQLETLIRELEELYLPTEMVVFQWIEHVRTFLEENFQSQIDKSSMQSQLESQSQNLQQQQPKKHDDDVKSLNVDIKVKHGEPVTFKKSKFQGHIAQVKSVEEASRVYKELLQDSKLAKATHNIMAYRISGVDDDNFVSDNDDDGETAAGSRLAHLLEIVGAKDVIVVVTRWYGGILLGPKRFKYINNVAREMLVKHGYID